MALKRVIPCLDVDAGRVVKGTNFVDLRDAGDPVELAARYDAEGADELVFLDITASHEKRDTIVELARRTADNVFIPFTIGGGIRSVADAQAVLDAGRRQGLGQLRGARAAGADRRARRGLRLAVRRRRDRREARRTERLGRLRRRRARRASTAARRSPGRARRPSAGRGRSCSPAWTATAPHDGYELELTRAVADAVGDPGDRLRRRRRARAPAEGIIEGGADAVLVASIFHYGKHTGRRGQGAPGRLPASRCGSSPASHHAREL